MRFSTIELLHMIDKQGRLFQKNNYIILNGRIFPVFFLQYMKLLLNRQYLIKDWTYVDCENFSKNQYSLDDNLYCYQENKLIEEVRESFGFIIDIKEKNELSIIKKIVDNPMYKNGYYIFFTYYSYENMIKGYSYYTVDDIINNEKRVILINFLKKHSLESDFESIYFFLKNYYKKIENYAYLEYIFTLFQYIPNIKKTMLDEFIDSYILDNMSMLYTDSFFDLATCFFQKKRDIFFQQWNSIKHKYTIEFWYYFWQDQLWYAQLALLNKAHLKDIIFYKKVNRWFLKTGIYCYESNDLLYASLLLYKLDSLIKKLQINEIIDLDSFFYIWFYRKSI